MDLAILLKLIFCGISPVVTVYTACEVGEGIAGIFKRAEDKINQFDWYRFPMKIRRMLPFTLFNVQEPVAIRCFGSIACTREYFRKVIWIKPQLNLNIHMVLMKYIMQMWVPSSAATSIEFKAPNLCNNFNIEARRRSTCLTKSSYIFTTQFCQNTKQHLRIGVRCLVDKKLLFLLWFSF